jgi:hypothetical protein
LHNFKYRNANVNFGRQSDNPVSKAIILIYQIGPPKGKKRVDHADPSVCRHIEQKINRLNILV